MRLRGKEIYIITGVIIVVVCVAWFFLFYNPLRKEVASLDAQVKDARQQVSTAQNELARLKSYEKTSAQTRADLLRLNKMLPSQSGIPSIIIELTRTAEEAGLEFVSIQPADIAPGQPFSVQTLNLSFAGEYFDLEDFLFRLESYVEYRNNAFLVTGRLLQVSGLTVTGGTEVGDPLQIQLTIQAYLWSSGGSSSANTTPPQPLSSPSPTESGSPSPTGTEEPTPTGTEEPTPTSTEGSP